MPRDMSPELTKQEPTTIELSRQEVIDLLTALDVQGEATGMEGTLAACRRWYNLRLRLQGERYRWD